MNRRFTKISTLLATVLLSIILIFACGIAGPTTGSTTDTTTGGGGDSSLSIMPTAVFSTSPELAAAVSVGSTDFPFAYFFNTANRADSGILNPEKMSELFMPLFTGLKAPKAGEMANNLTVDYVGYYLKRPILIKMVDKTAENTDDNFAKVFEFSYYQDNTGNKVVDVGGLEPDTLVAFVYIRAYTDTATAGEWALTQSIANPFNPTEKFTMKASGIYGPSQLTGDGTFTATSGDYKGSAAVTWTKNSTGKKFIKIEDGKIEYKGTKTNDFYNVTGLNITIDIAADNSSKVIENSTVVTKNLDGSTLTIVKQATTLNDQNGIPTEVAFTISKTLRNINGVITDNTTKQGAKTITVDSSFNIAVTDTNATNLNIGDLTVTDDDATPAKITINLSKCPTAAMGKSVSVWIVKPENMIYEADGTVHPNVTITPVFIKKGVVSSTYGASFTTDTDIPAGNYVAYAIIDPLGNFPATPTNENVGPTTSDDFYAFSAGVLVDGRKNAVTTVKMGNTSYNEPEWRTFGSGTTDIRPSLDVSITFTSKDNSTYFNQPAFDGKTIQMQVGLFEVTSMGINWNAPVGYSFIELKDPTIDLTLKGNKLYIDGIVDFKNKKYTVGARLDMDNNGMDSVGDFYYMDTSVDVALKFDNYNNKYYISIPGFSYISAVNTNTGSDFSTYKPDGNPLITSTYYTTTAPATITGSIDPMVDRSQASAWFAILMPIVSGPEEGANTAPIAFAEVKLDGSFTFTNLSKGAYGTGAPNYYNIVAVGYRNFDINYDKLRMPYQDDILAMKATVYTYTYFDAAGVEQTSDNYSNSPLALTFNTAGSQVGIKWIDNGVFQPDPDNILTTADLKLDISMLYMDATTGDTGTSSGISIGTGDKPVYVTVGFDDPMNFQYSSTDRPYWLSDTSFGVKIEKKVNGIWTYVTENWSNFRDSAYNAIYYVSFDCKDANLNAVYRFTVSQETFNPDKNMPVKFTGSSGEITISDNNYAYIGLKEEPVVVLSGTDDVEIILQLPEMVTDTIYTKSALTGKFAYVELMDQNFVSKYIMKVQIGDTTYTYDGTNYNPLFGAIAIFNAVPKNNYYIRAFIDWDGSLDSVSMEVGATLETKNYSNISPDQNDIHPNFQYYTPMVYMDVEKYTDPVSSYTYPYSSWLYEWVEILWGGGTGGTAVGTININYPGFMGKNIYVRVYDYAMQFPFEPSSGWIAGTLDASGMANIQLMGVYTEAEAYYVEVLIDMDGLTASMATDQNTAWPETGDYHTDTLVPFSFTNGIQVPVGESNFVLVP